MPLDLSPAVAALAQEMTAWRRGLHAHPETAYEETRTARFVADRLQDFGLEVTTGVGRTGVVGVLTRGRGPAIALRADMDALAMDEATGVAHASQIPGRMHACGHDGHVAMLLGAAKHLASSPSFRGVVVFIFQPAEEGEAGAKAMIDDGLFERFPVDGVYGLHNWPNMDFGTFAVQAGPVMAAYEAFTAEIRGVGAHGGMPHQGVDSIVVAAQVINAWQTIVSRSLAPHDAAVVSVTSIHGGESFNILPETVTLKGAVRSLSAEAGERAWDRLVALAENIAAGHGARFTGKRHRTYPATVNAPEQTRHAYDAARDVVGADNVVGAFPASMGAEDFAFMLERTPGCYVWMGTRQGDDQPGLHHPKYHFNDEALTIGASYWVRLVERLLPL
ncbi:MAG: amidohydrolase [Alphaproteobacteria bacterium]|nr:amidohydrolase [Alphaproteobacteria bacterium]